MNAPLLCDAIRSQADLVMSGKAMEHAQRRDTVDLLYVLARLVMGEPMFKAFGAPGDWGYEHPIGAALFRKLCGLSETEAAALDDLRDKLIEHARAELCAGRELHTWESSVPEITPEMKRLVRLVRLTNLKHELKTRAAQWGGERQLLPAHAVERCLADIDALVSRHAMQIQGVTPPPAKET